MDKKEIKGTLEKENQLYKTALDHEVEELQEEAKRVGKIALIAGGALLGSYLLVKLLRKKKDKKCTDGKSILGPARTQVVVEKPVKENPFMKMLKEQAVLIIAGLVREKLSEFTGAEKHKVKEKENELIGKSKSA